jgi:hypothetical protein
MENYTPYGKEWEAEMNKLPKAELIKMIRKLQTGTEDKKICGVDTSKEAQHIVEGIINDFEAGLSTKSETMYALGEYTARLMEIFWKNAKARFNEKPELLT